MTQSIYFKRSAVAGKVPLLTDLAMGEVALNTLDGAIYMRKTVNGTDTIVNPMTMLNQNSQSANYTTIATDAAKQILHPVADTAARTFTIDSNANVPYQIGTIISFVNQNGAGVVTIAINSDVMRWLPSGTTGSRTLAANGQATALKITATEWQITGTGIS